MIVVLGSFLMVVGLVERHWLNVVVGCFVAYNALSLIIAFKTGRRWSAWAWLKRRLAGQAGLV
nr:hypothetical protein [Oceanococcus sp. HetDA_MAG_MS8]